MSKKQTINEGFVSAPEAARLLACSVQNIRTNYLPRLGGDDVRAGRPTLIRFSALVDMIVERRIEQQLQRPVAVVDPLLAGGDSVGLERFRLAKAKIAEMDLAERCGELIDVSKARDILGRWASILRRAGERIGRLSPEAGKILADSLDELQDVIREFDR